jgi:peptide/nickel transport system permease protein
VFVVVYILNFIIPRLEPGNFASTIASSEFDAQTRKRIEELLGIDKPLSAQFVIYVQQSLGSFPPNFGVSFSHYPQTVWSVVTAGLPWTLLLILTSQSIAWIGGILLGAVLAWRQGSKADSFAIAISNFMWGVPSYWLASILIFVFAVKLHFFPAALTVSGLAGADFFSQAADILTHAFLPVATLVIILLPLNALTVRNTMVHVLQEDFMFAAKARGLKTFNLIFGHALRNALLPSVTAMALTFGTVLSGAYLVEIIYSYPGLGYLITRAVFTRDYPVIEGVFFFSALLVIVANVIADFAYVFLDPRVEF